MKNATVKVGQKIKQGDVIGHLQEYEKGNGHLHFDVRRPGKQKSSNVDGPVCPMPYFNEQAKGQIEYLRQKSQGSEKAYIDSSGHYTQICF